MKLVLALLPGILVHGGTEASSPDSSARGAVVEPEKFALIRSYGPATSSSLSPAGNVFACYRHNTVVLYDAITGKETYKLAGHTGNIHDSGWSLDGRWFVTSGYDATVRVWEVATGRNRGVFTGHSDYACSVGVSPDGKYVVSGGSSDSRILIHDLATAREIRSIPTPGGATYTIGLTGDGSAIVANHADGSFRAWKTCDGSEAKTLDPSAGNVHTFASSRDGRLVAYPDANGGIVVIETTGWGIVGRLEGHNGGTSFLAFHPRGRHLASSGKDGSLKIWDLASQRLVNALPEGVGADSRLAFTGDGQSLIVTGADQIVRIFGKKR